MHLMLLQACTKEQLQTRLVAKQMTTLTKEQLKYYLYFPEDYVSQPNEKFGLLLFLHGGGEAGGKSLEEIKSGGPPKLLAEGKEFPFLILAPQNPHKLKWWNTQAVMQLLDSVVADHRVDPKRLYLTGLSRGGSASWDIAAQYPETFAAMAVVCGMTPTPYANWIDSKMPIWVFHGVEDRVIPVQESDEMVAILKDMGHSIRYTRYEGVAHDAWTKAYTTDSLYTWLSEQSR